MELLSGDQGSVLTAHEAERLIEQLQPRDIEEVGSKKWMKQREVIEKLNLQSHLNVVSNSDEFVVEAFLSFEKIPVLIHELIVIETWKSNVGPLLAPDLLKLYQKSSKPYLIYYHEGVIANLLECMFYQKDAVLAADDYLVDLLDWCHRKITWLTLTDFKKEDLLEKDAKVISKQTTEEEWEDKKLKSQFVTAMCALTICRYITDHVNEIPVSVVTRMLDTYDLPLSLVYLIEKAPWKIKGDKGKVYKFKDGKFVEMSTIDAQQLGTHDVQPWIAIYNLLFDPESRNRYYMHSFRKNEILKLKKYLTTTLVDQVETLAQLSKWLHELEFVDMPESTQQPAIFVIEVMPKIREKLLKIDFEELAQKQLKKFNEELSKEDLDSLANLYSHYLSMIDQKGKDVHDIKLK